MNKNVWMPWWLAAMLLGTGAGARSADQLPPGIVRQAISLESLPADMRLQGKPVEVVGWSDLAGESVVVLAKGDERRVDELGGRRSRLFAGQFTRRGPDSRWTRVWSLMDEVDSCQVDIVCSFVRGSLELTDLDGNGFAEVSFVYRLACVGDVSPWGQKLMLFDGGKKYAVRGQTVQADEGGRAMNSSRMTIDKAFDVASPAILQFAVKKWQRFAGHDLPLY
jgi:hypothetical protein